MSHIDKLGTEIEVDQALVNVGGNRFEMILIAATRAREIESTRRIAQNADSNLKYRNRTVSAALQEIEEGKIGREYLDRLRQSR
jgi:DNA-directed RNA polymerase omega subunit